MQETNAQEENGERNISVVNIDSDCQELEQDIEKVKRRIVYLEKHDKIIKEIAKIFIWLTIGAIVILTAVNAFSDEIDDIVPAIIQVESGGNPNAVSPAGAIGLMQITPIVLKEFNNSGLNHLSYKSTCVWDNKIIPYEETNGLPILKQELFVTWINKSVGKWYLRRLKNHYLKDKYTIERMLAAYNGGITRLKKVNYDINKMPKETRQYVRKVMKIYDQAKSK